MKACKHRCMCTGRGDFGKKELSPALRNRFTEIWVPAISELSDLEAIESDRLSLKDIRPLASPMLEFWQWFANHPAKPSSCPLSVRDVLIWASYIKRASQDLSGPGALIHGAFTTILDGVGVGSGISDSAIKQLRNESQEFLLQLVHRQSMSPSQDALVLDGSLQELPTTLAMLQESIESNRDKDVFGVPPFQIVKGTASFGDAQFANDFRLDTPTTTRNMLRVLRG